MANARPGESSATVAARVGVARLTQWSRRQSGQVSAPTNACLSLREAEEVTSLSDSGRKLIQHATARLGLSARAYLRILRVARSIADLEGTERVSESQLSEAIQGRLLDRGVGL